MSKPRASFVELLSRAHAALLADLEELEAATSFPSTAMPARFAQHLRRVRRHLMEHFRFEERDGYMTAVRKREPQRDRDINHLLQEHRQLAHALDTLIEQASPGREGVPADQVRAWIGQVRLHETHENALVEEVFNRDLIAAD